MLFSQARIKSICTVAHLICCYLIIISNQPQESEVSFHRKAGSNKAEAVKFQADKTHSNRKINNAK